MDDSTRDLADLIRCGKLIPASDLAPPALPVDDPDLSIDSTDVISDLREEHRRSPRRSSGSSVE